MTDTLEKRMVEMSCPHQSAPVEMDESMTSSSLNLAWPACRQCTTHADDVRGDWRTPEATVDDVAQVEYLRGGPLRSKGTEPKATHPPQGPLAGGLRLHHLHLPDHHSDRFRWRPLQDDMCKDLSAMFPQDWCDEPVYVWNPPSESDESLEQPLPLCSDVNERMWGRAPLWPPGPGPHPADRHALQAGLMQCPRLCPCQHPPVPQTHHLPRQHTPEYQQNTQARQSPPNPVVHMAMPQVTVPPCQPPVRELMSKICLPPTQPISTSHGHIQEMKRTISLPDDCRTVFITYSVDLAQEMIPFVKFLITNGFRPAIDIFDHAVQQMDMNRWMDSYLKNKSVLIIVAISPKYKFDVEGDGSDQHGLHTKYIHTQIQNEFIQQRCLNFRLIPVMFPNANQTHVPMWLQSTRLFRWPQDAQDLLLRLLREERYIPPPLGKELTLIIKPL
ncbi:adapter protein CIKS isoform X1 [Electrophorus electricus]|uniref:adapter protein CIKS isoform X1 n=2 Tax=Electrophorus electricus TaxID=8005 RepID=UPI0015D0079E|nr:adapter protein CIKS isoform X1 [Electrophorus electricus]